MAGGIVGALRRARWGILSVGAAYAVGVVAGALMVAGGNSFALATRDGIVAGAQDSAALVARRQGDVLRAAAIDFGQNLIQGGLSSTITGIAVVGPYPIALYRGWVGGIVSVDSHHQSRLATRDSAIYYLVTLILQLIPYTLTGGAGVMLGLEAWRTRSDAAVRRWLTLPTAALLDVARIYVLVVPLFLIASLWEFLA